MRDPLKRRRRVRSSLLKDPMLLPEAPMILLQLMFPPTDLPTPPNLQHTRRKNHSPPSDQYHLPRAAQLLLPTPLQLHHPMHHPVHHTQATQPHQAVLILPLVKDIHHHQILPTLPLTLDTLLQQREVLNLLQTATLHQSRATLQNKATLLLNKATPLLNKAILLLNKAIPLLNKAIPLQNKATHPLNKATLPLNKATLLQSPTQCQAIHQMRTLPQSTPGPMQCQRLSSRPGRRGQATVQRAPTQSCCLMVEQ